MTRNHKKATALSFVILATLLIVILSQSVNAQTDVATVVIPSSVGGTTDPAPGTYTYPNGTAFILTATPDAGYVFQYWIISGDYTPGHTGTQPTFFTDPDTGLSQPFPVPAAQSSLNSLVLYSNPQTITCGYGYTYQYQAVFAPIGGPSPAPGTTDAVVVILPSTGGTVSPATGTYNYANGTTFTLTATPAAGYVFHYWVVAGNYTSGHASTTSSPTFFTDPDTGQIFSVPRTPAVSGLDSLVFTTNPVTMTCGYGYTYQYQAVFDLAVSSSASPSQSTSPTASPAQTVSPTEQPTVTPASSASPLTTESPNPSPGTEGGVSTTVIVAIVVVIIIIIVVIAAVMMRKKK
jgi:hypothetical protein